MNNKQVKGRARQNLLGFYPVFIATWLLIEILVVAIDTPFSTMASQGLAFGVYTRVAIGYVGSVFVTLLATVLNAGVLYLHLKRARGEAPAFKDVLYPITHRPDRYIGYGLLLLVIAVALQLPSLLCVYIAAISYLYILVMVSTMLSLIGLIILVILAFGWSQCIFLLLDDEELRTIAALRKSWQLMHRKKARLFGLVLSFIGWLLLGMLSLGIGLLWIVPYLEQSITCFYLELLPVQEADPEVEYTPY